MSILSNKCVHLGSLTKITVNIRDDKDVLPNLETETSKLVIAETYL